MRTVIASLAATLFLANAAAAQQVTFVGKVEDVQGTTNQFRVGCTNTALTSSTINLNNFLGATVEASGQWNGSVIEPSVEVETLQLAAETFEISGGAKIGETSQLSFTGNPGDFAIGVLTPSSSFHPFKKADGVIFIDLSMKGVQLSGIIGGTGILELPFTLPNDPALVGFEMFGQGALLGGGVRMTNPDCKTIGD